MLWFRISVFFALFLNSSLANLLGITNVVTVAFLPLTILLGFEIIFKKMQLFNNKIAVQILIISICFLFFQLALKNYFYFKFILNFTLIPIIASIYFDSITISQKKILKFTVELFYLAQCVISITEKILQKTLIYNPIKFAFTEYSESWQFRSTALIGHPLSNAMVVAVIMTFIILDKKMSQTKKFVMVFLGIASLFSFDARGALIVALAFIIPYFLYSQYKGSKKFHRMFLVFSNVVIFYFAFSFLSESDFGGRLLNSTIVDESSMSRFNVFNFYKYVDWPDLLFGNKGNYLFVSEKLNAAGIENGIITMIVENGLIFTIIILILLFKFVKQKLYAYSNNERNLILIVFFGIGFMNPNLARPVQWMILILTMYAYKPLVENIQKSPI